MAAESGGGAWVVGCEPGLSQLKVFIAGGRGGRRGPSLGMLQPGSPFQTGAELRGRCGCRGGPSTSDCVQPRAGLSQGEKARSPASPRILQPFPRVCPVPLRRDRDEGNLRLLPLQSAVLLRNLDSYLYGRGLLPDLQRILIETPVWTKRGPWPPSFESRGEHMLNSDLAEQEM